MVGGWGARESVDIQIGAVGGGLLPALGKIGV